VIEFGNHVIHFDQLPSTNAYAVELLSRSKPAEGTIISTDNQYDGKGQLSNKWESEALKNISLSIILYPSFLNVEDQFKLSQAVSIAVYTTIQAYVASAISIKWPNDIYIGSDKVAGILIQNQIQGKHIASSVVGIGININQELFKSDAPNPISLFNVLRKSVDIVEFKTVLFQNLSQQYQALRLGAYRQLDASYLKVLYRKNQLCNYQIKDNLVIQGSIVGVSNGGLLQVLIDGQMHEYGFKEIKYL